MAEVDCLNTAACLGYNRARLGLRRASNKGSNIGPKWARQEEAVEATSGMRTGGRKGRLVSRPGNMILLQQIAYTVAHWRTPFAGNTADMWANSKFPKTRDREINHQNSD